MNMVIIAVFDVAASAFHRPQFVASRGIALRMFQDEVNREAADNVMFHHPGDFQVFEFGSFNDNDGRFSLLDVPVRLVTASDVKVVKS